MKVQTDRCCESSGKKSKARKYMLAVALAAAAIMVGLSVFADALTQEKEGMTKMPMIHPKRSYTVTGKEDFDSQVGFGEQTPMVNMMNLMMVEGAGYEHMDMSAAHSGMKMAGQKPPEQSSAGPIHQTGKPEASMKEVPTMKSPFKIEATLSPNPPKAGTHDFKFKVIDQTSGKSVTGLKLKAKVHMTSMDMGTTEPKVKENPPGVYALRVTFSMEGPWELQLFDGAKFDQKFQFAAGGQNQWKQQDQ